jgi:hypothetical protein
MKTLEKFTKEMIDGFIAGTQASYERGDTIDPRKELTFIVTDSGNKFHIKAIWIKGITQYPLVNPMTDKDDVHHFEDYYFSISRTDTIIKASDEIHEAIDYINLNQYLNY